MKTISRNADKNSMQRVITVVAGTAANVALAWATGRLGLPLYLDTAGTIGAAAVGGLFPGIMTALATNLLCGFFNPCSIYYSTLNVLIAICTAWLVQKGRFKKASGVTTLILASALIGGGFGALIQWGLLGGPQFGEVSHSADAIAGALGCSRFAVFTAINIGLNLVDKTLSTLLALFVLRFVPEERRRAIWNSGWRQKPLSESEIREFRTKIGEGGRSLQTKMTLMLTLAAVTLTVVMGVVSLRLHLKNEHEEYTKSAMGAARFAAAVIDADRVDDYIAHGESAEGYEETRQMLYSIRENSSGVKYLYVVKIRHDGCYVAFDLETEDTPPYEPGDKIEFEDAFIPYLPALFAGEEIDPIESDDISGWVLTAYYPVRNAQGKTVCYAAADVAMEYLAGYVGEYLLRAFLIFSGFFVLVLAYGLWISRIYLVYPINSMAACADGFMNGAEGQEGLDENVRKLKALDIHTGDEVEKLYRAICRMTLSTAEQMREIRYFAAANEKMQNGIIITMANMVENRDSDTGAHIQKTAAYVKIIMERMKEKGYYAEKLTPRYIADVVMSAPLHDVGKISIPDAVLNKPGKLTPEEYEIMKSHTTAGKEIMEHAISTVEGENYLKEARNMAAYHHERWDGKGYPDGLRGEVIPLSARVMAVADVFDALTSARVYKPPFSLEKAAEMIADGAGSQFDPKCVEAFVDSLTQVRLVLKKYQDA